MDILIVTNIHENYEQFQPLVMDFQTLKTQPLTYKLHVNTILPWLGHFLV